MAATKLPNLCLLFCGGTIAMARDERSGALAPATDPHALLRRVPELASIASIDPVFITNVDSSNVMPQNWLAMARAVAERIDLYDGFVVTHGTDTMAYSASAASFLLQELSKPVVFTGSQTPIDGAVGSDARNNLIFAATFATLDIAEVCIFFGHELLRANRARKFSQFDYDAFKSFNLPPLGKIGLQPKLAEHHIRRAPRQLRTTVENDSKVFLLKYFPGLVPEIMDAVVGAGYHGIVIEGAGAGNLPTTPDFAAAIRRAGDQGVPVVVTTQCIVGSAEMHIYEVGKIAEQAGAISAHDMTSEAALTKLWWCLSQTRDLGQIRSLMQTNLAGEITC